MSIYTSVDISDWGWWSLWHHKGKVRNPRGKPPMLRVPLQWPLPERELALVQFSTPATQKALHTGRPSPWPADLTLRRWKWLGQAHSACKWLDGGVRSSRSTEEKLFGSNYSMSSQSAVQPLRICLLAPKNVDCLGCQSSWPRLLNPRVCEQCPGFHCDYGC